MAKKLSPEQEVPTDIYVQAEELYRQAETFQYTDFIEALKLLEEGYNLLEESDPGRTDLKRGPLTISYLKKLTFINFQSANYCESKRYADLLFDASVFFSDKDAEADAYTSFANIYSDTGDFKKAFEYNSKALEIRTETNNLGGMAVSYNNLGNILKYENNLDDALAYFKKALKIFEKNDRKPQISSVLQNIATIYIQMEKYDEALDVLNESIRLKKTFDDARGIAYGTHLIGEVLLGRGDFECAVANFRNAIEMQKHLDDKISLIICYPLLSKALMQMYLKSVKEGNADASLAQQAEEYLTAAMELATAAESKANLTNIYKSFSEYYEQLDEYNKAHCYLKKYCETARELFNKNLAEEILKYKKDIELKEANHIAEMNKIRNVELAATVEKLEVLSRQKNEFFGIVVHDLKNPIGNIKSLAEFLFGDEELTPEEKREFKKHIIEIADNSLNLITKLLDNAAIEQGKIVLTPADINIKDEILRIIKLYKRQTVAKKLKVGFESNLNDNVIHIDKNSIVNIFDNLYSNAIKFSPVGKNIHIKLSREEKFFKLEVKDEGQGLTESDKKNLFTEFSKLSAKPTGGEHSSGLGLSIVKKLTESLNGSISYESETGKGLNMIVKIPLY